MANWLILDEKLKCEWECEASRLVHQLCGVKINVKLGLPTLKAAKRAYRKNEDLYGTISWCDEGGQKLGVYELLPFHGVFIVNNPGEARAQAVTWNSYLERIKTGATVSDVDDLSQRRLMTFPRQLLKRFCSKMKEAAEKDKVFDGSYWGAMRLVPVETWLRSKATLLQRVCPNNAVEMMSQIFGVRRYVVSRDGAMGYSLKKRINHPSFDGRLCPVDTPESELVGISLQLARGASVDKDGRISPAEGTKAIDKVSWGASLIPFAHHNDGARDMMGAKNLRQASPVKGREEPSVKSGAEKSLADAMAPLMDAGVCPESRVDDKGCIAMGRDLLVAYIPWNGWNLDDAIVVSDSIVNDMAVTERKTFSRKIESRHTLKSLAKRGKVTSGSVIASFVDPKGRELAFRYNDETPAELIDISFGDGKLQPDGAFQILSYELEKEIPLGLGDKLMARHGNKGVVGRVLPAAEMPRLPDDDRLPAAMRGRSVEILVNPHGILSRMNPGQLLETHLGWLLKAGGRTEDDVRTGGSTASVGAPCSGVVDLEKVQSLLEKTGLDRNGRVRLVLPNGEETQNPVVVGYEHFVRLHHIPELKAQARLGGGGASYDLVTWQPAHGRKAGGGQRLGEMEVWALCAHGADYVLEEMLGAKSDKDWRGEWRVPDGVPSGKGEDNADKYGFAHFLHDWLRALCIGLSFDLKNGEAQLSFISNAEELKKAIGGEGKRVTSEDACTKVDKGHFSCGECGWGIPGEFSVPSDKRRGQTLKFGELLKGLGYDGTGLLVSVGKDAYEVELTKSGSPAGRLQVCPRDYDPDATTFNVVVSPSADALQSGWPQKKEFRAVHLRAKPTAVGVELEKFKLAKAKRQRALPARCLLEELQDAGSRRSLASDFSVTCPEHPAELLRIGPPYDTETHFATGGLFDTEIFDGKDGWGYIELPEPVKYPYWESKKGGRLLKTVEGVDISVIPVLPLHYRRPMDKSRLSVDARDISHYYQQIVLRCKEYEKSKNDDSKGKKLVEIAQSVADLFMALSARLESKSGFLRHAGLGRRVDRSFRLVITPNPELGWDEAGVPTAVLWEILGDRLDRNEGKGAGGADEASRVNERKAGWTWHNRKLPDDAYGKVSEFLEKNPDLVVLLNRQPTLLRDGMQAFHPVAIPPGGGETLQLSPLCCKGFAADFDGGEMAGHYPVSSLAQEDARKMLPSNNLRSIGTGECLANLDRDFVTGLELVRHWPERYLVLIDAEFKTDGLELDGDAETLLKDASLEPGAVGKKLFDLWCRNCPETAAGKIGALSRVAYRVCTKEGLSFGFFDLLAAKVEPADAADEKGEWRVVDDASPFALMVNSGANGAKQIRQVVKSRGKLEAVDANGNAVSVDVGNVSLVAGMSWDDFFKASQNARYSMGVKKIGTQKAGSLTRQLVLGLWGWTIAEEDCGIPDGDSRSVLTCRCRKNGGRSVCAKCFGTLPNGEEPWIGMPIGLVAAQTLGERGTQLSMRVFHAGGNEIDFEGVSKTMRGGEPWGNADDFVSRLRSGAYAKIDQRYFQLLWRALDSAPRKTLASAIIDPFAKLASGSQMELIRLLAKDAKPLSLDSPFAKVFFNLFGSREIGEVLA